MFIPSFDEITEITDSRYSLVMLIAKRAREIIDGSEVLVNGVDEDTNPVTVAFREVMDRSIVFADPSDSNSMIQVEEVVENE
ncbi:MAG: DNA-directed RNA polymerase subunit omega [Tissierellia bacterium]|nr:DNA-directed RNA polymerase subunit omega [Tissierellia bacterium]